MLKLKNAFVLPTLVLGCAAFAHAATISVFGDFNATGTDSFTSSTISFNPNVTAPSPPSCVVGGPCTANNSVVAGAISGSFMNYLTDGDLITFLPGSLPYVTGNNNAPNPPFTLGYVPNFFTVTGNGETFAFNLQSYNANYISSGTGALGCMSGDTCLLVTGTGFYDAFAGTSATGTPNGVSGPATFEFTSQYSAGESSPAITSFSASTVASAIPEPAPLALVGSGLLGLVGLLRRRIQRA